ncbi:MAG: PQQ-like beta-propeller repeat protein [Proteobacteria bacterium]|nr:PQQ-like beta-propeller repeat protein [Pseudomonadota bacterium]
MNQLSFRVAFAAIAITWVALVSPAALYAEDWPQYRGPSQDGISSETGLLASWPEGGPEEVWRVSLGAGYSAVSIADGKLYTMYNGDGAEWVVCLDANTGEEIWKTEGGKLYKDGQGDGPRSAPAVDEGFVYTLSPRGMLLGLNKDTGEKIWGFNALERFGGNRLQWGLSTSPLVHGNLLLVAIGGERGKGVVALHKRSGREIWSSLGDKASYATPYALTVDGMPQVAFFMQKAVVGLSPEDGRELWRQKWSTDYDVHAAMPIFSDGILFISSGYDTGSGAYELTAQGGKMRKKELWTSNKMKNKFNSSILIDGYIYGFHNTILTCMELSTGDVKWSQRGFNEGSLIGADGRLIIMGGKGQLALAEVSPEAYREISRVEGILSGTTWTMPSLSNGKLYLRSQSEVVCLNLKP